MCQLIAAIKYVRRCILTHAAVCVPMCRCEALSMLSWLFGDALRREPYLRAPLRPRPSIELGLLPRPRPLPLPRPRPPPPLALTPVTRSPSSAASTADALSTAALSPERSAASRAARASASRCRGASVVGGEVEGMGTKGSDGMGRGVSERWCALKPRCPRTQALPGHPRLRARARAHTRTPLRTCSNLASLPARSSPSALATQAPHRALPAAAFCCCVLEKVTSGGALPHFEHFMSGGAAALAPPAARFAAAVARSSSARASTHALHISGAAGSFCRRCTIFAEKSPAMSRLRRQGPAHSKLPAQRGSRTGFDIAPPGPLAAPGGCGARAM